MNFNLLNWKEYKLLIGIMITFLFLIAILYAFKDYVYYDFGQRNYTSIHVFMEFCIIYFSFAIAIQTWLGSYFHHHNKRILFGALFMIMAIFEMVHTLTYSEMPFFIFETGPNLSIWFTTIQRLVLPIGFIIIYIGNENRKKYNSAGVFITTITYTLFLTVIFFQNVETLPQLLTDSGGPTAFRYVLHFILIALEVSAIIVILFKRKTIEYNYPFIVCAFVCLILCEITYLQYRFLFDLNVLVAHLFHLAAFILLFFAIYFSQVRKPFEELKSAHEKLEESKVELTKIAYYDQQTNLPNMYALRRDLLKIDKTDLSLIVFGLNRFDTIRATLSNNQVQRLIGMVSERISNKMPHVITLYHFDSDHLAIAVDHENDKYSTQDVVDLIQQSVEEPFSMKHFTISVKPHIGIAHFPNDTDNVGELMQFAFFAMTEAAEKNILVTYYNNEMQKEREKRLMLEQDLKHAMDGQLFLYYQPKLDLHANEILSLEALLRWEHPTKGSISPLEFIPIAEESGLIIPIGQWVLETACRETVEMQKVLGKPIRIAINLSLAQLFQPNFVEKISETIKKTGIDPVHVELEITESMTKDTLQVIPLLKRIKDLGISIAIDDFGTGYSSLSYLKNLPIDVLKIDRSFIRNVLEDKKDEALVNMVLSMAHHLELKVVAEGVESAEQLNFLLKKNCDNIQGYFISKPLSFNELVATFKLIEQNAKEKVQSFKLNNA